MLWLKRKLWKTDMVITGALLLLVLIAWTRVSVVDAHEVKHGLIAPVTVQAIPTEDATVAALNKEKLAQEVQQLKNQNEAGPLGWLQTNASILLSTLVVVIGVLIGFFRWVGDRQDERVKRAEERFQSAVTGLGSKKEGAKIGAAILLRTFLRQGYKQFYTQTFDLAVANLRLPRTPQSPEDSNAPLPSTPLSEALIVVFKEAFPHARSLYPHDQSQYNPQSLDASGIQLDNAYMRDAKLEQAWMPQASLRKADLSEATLNGATLNEANLNGAKLNGARLNGASLRRATLNEADLGGARLNGARLNGARLNGASLRRAELNGAELNGAELKEAKLFNAGLNDADLSGAKLNNAELNGAWLNRARFFSADLRGADFKGAVLRETDIEKALFLNGANLHGVYGLTKEQLETCKENGAIIDEDPTTSSS